MHQAFCQIVPLDRYNWELCLNINLTPEQERFVPSILYSLAQAKFENLHPFGVLHHDEIVGFIMYGEFGGICWINRIVIDKEFQGMGIGRSAVRQLVELLSGKIGCKEIRTSVSAENLAARRFFQTMGFSDMQQAFDDEVVLVYRPAY